MLALLLLIQDAVEVKTNDGGGTPRVRFSVTSGATTAEVWVRRGRLQFDTGAGSEGFLNVASSASGAPAAGDLRYSAGILLFHDGSAWQTVATTTGGLFLARNATDTSTASAAGGPLYTLTNSSTTSGSYALLGRTTSNSTANGTYAGVKGEASNSDSNADGTDVYNMGVIGAGYGAAPNAGNRVTNYGVYGDAVPIAGAGVTTNIGVYGLGRGAGATATNYGLYGQAITGTGTNVGIFATASGGATNYAAWFSGNTYVDGATGVGIAPSSSYRLFVRSDSSIPAAFATHDVASGNTVLAVGFGTTQKFTVNGVGQILVASNHSGGNHLSVRDGSTMLVQDTQLLFADGAVGGPGFSFVNDTNTGIYRIGVDTLGFSTAGGERIRVSSTGMVGINHTNPSQFLTLDGNNNQFLIESTTGGIADVDYRSGAGSVWASGTGWSGSGGGANAFYWYVVSERMYLTETGTLRVNDDVQVGDQLHFPNQNNTKLAVRRWSGFVPGAGVATVYSDAYVSIGLQSDSRIVFMPAAGYDGWWDYSSYGTLDNTGGAELDPSTSAGMRFRTDDIFTTAGTWYACSFALTTSWSSAANIHLNKEANTAYPSYVIHTHNHSSASIEVLVEVYFP